jgi:hypothetical protein
VVEVFRDNPKYFFKYVQSKAKIKTGVGLLKDNDVYVGNDYGMCELLKSQFESAFSSSCYSRQMNEIEVLMSYQADGGWRTLSLDQKMWKCVSKNWRRFLYRTRWNFGSAVEEVCWNTEGSAYNALESIDNRGHYC